MAASDLFELIQLDMLKIPKLLILQIGLLVECIPQKYPIVNCTSLQLQGITADAGIDCEPCDGRGWLVCDFCKGQKTNVKSETNCIYRRCPSCRAVGYVLCSKCKVFKCVTFRDQSDAEK